NKLIPVAPAGDGLEVVLRYPGADGKPAECPVTDWVVNARNGNHLTPKTSGPQWLFSGSIFAKRQGREVYDADGAGAFIGLCTFGSEAIAWRDTISPEATVEEPVWIADAHRVPAAGTSV